MTIELQYPLGSYSVDSPPSNETLKGDLTSIQIAVNTQETELSAHMDDTSTHGVSEIADVADLSPSGSLALAIMSALNPIGTIREFNVATNPATLLGFGTWSAFGTGRVTVAIDAGQTEFDVNGETGGEKTHLLTGEESGEKGHNHIQDSHLHGLSQIAQSSSGGATTEYGYLSTASHDTSSTQITAGTDSATATNQAVAAANAASAHNNLQPYIVVYRWVRTA